MAIISIRNLVKSYGKGGEKQNIFDGLNLDINSNTFVSILGRSGSGKTTLLNSISTLDEFDSGQIYIDGFNVNKLSKSFINRLRNRYIGFVFQEFNLIDDISILDNVAMPLVVNNLSLKEARKLAAKALQNVGLNQFLKLKPKELSGGQKQRVAIARAIVNDQKIILCDEPTGALDDYTSDSILALLKDLTNDRTVIMVTHDEEYAKKYSDRILVLSDGEILYDSDEESLNDDIEKNKKSLKSNRKQLKISQLFTMSRVSFNFNNKQLTKAMNAIINSTIIFLLAAVVIKYINQFLGLYFINFVNTPVMSAIIGWLNISNDSMPKMMIYGVIYAFLLFSFISFLFIFNMVIHDKRKEIAVMKAFGADQSMIRKILVIKTFTYALLMFKKLVIKTFLLLFIIKSIEAIPYILKAEYSLFIEHVANVVFDTVVGAFKKEVVGAVNVNFLRLILTYLAIVFILVFETMISSFLMNKENTIKVLARE